MEEKENMKNTEQEKTNKNQSPEDQKNKEFLDDAKESIIEGAKVISEEAKHFEKIISSKAGVILDKLKGQTSEAIDTSAELTREAYNKAVSMIESYKDKQEAKKLIDTKNEMLLELGLYIYLTYKTEKVITPELLNDPDVEITIHNISDIEEKIIKLADEAKTK